ncbi:MAG: branched-chain amino acid ABC transporter permease [Microbacterium sp.]|jgi:branched-chain amino acid transport system permease protein|uniref:Branched-chain amino acid ABC transporter permease n=1 Tax=Microbacterium ginsengisoli TaxID=400772 RepID=A0A0F0LPH0_9MICO|nr:branched-chain amino acid ABC transporter permease [Microbacterium ginsengisoli]MAL05638.1 branched-chain amino acid ABC transporter permease [Microbacterium sp.]KJL34793.1 High-affinity branched-chain amino acid transport system permease protein LivH [Microbacterium ginsengisoli]KJL35122.1 High-affinity branched-chain amino acid transport system permease protein LivH [Microbacterium ginsengisoli]MBN9207600.1 branched-chain amino acid ABC transporter permease [Microbacterium ginsengisoli]HA
MNLLPFLVAGLVIGSVYALSGVGVLVLYRTTGVLNFAHGAIGALAAMLLWQLVPTQGRLQPAIGIAVCILIAAAAALLFGLLAGPYLARIDELRKAIATLGFALVIIGVLLFTWNDKARTLRLDTSSIAINVGGTRVNLTQIICLLLAVLVVVATVLAFRYTSIGMSMRALASDRELASVVGTNVRLVENVAWALSGAIAGASGILLANQTRLEPAFLTFLIIPELAAVVIGRFSSLWLTLVGGLVIGVLQTLASAWEPITAYATIVPFLIATVVILIGRRRVLTIGVVRS